MTLELESIELSNIRSHKAIVFEPAKEGVTSIQGANGTGKSTIVDSLSWILYGTKPQGVSKVSAIIREGAELPKDRVYATAILNVNGKRYKVNRKIISKNGGVECEVFLQAADETWENVAGPAVTHAEPYIRKMMNMDEKGFLSAILVQQKQVDQLISSGPRERASIIEKLTGISSVTTALTEARQEYNSVRKMATYSNVDEVEYEKLGKEKLKAEQELEKLVEKHNTNTYKEKSLKKSGIELKKQVEEIEKNQQSSLVAEKRLATIVGLIEAKDKELERVFKEKELKKNKLSTIASGGSLKEVEENIAKLEKQKTIVGEKSFKTKSLLQDAQETLESYQHLLELSSIKTLDEATKGLATQETKQRASIKKISEAKKEQANCETKIDSISSAINILQQDEGACPTCLQKVHDVTAAVQALEKEKEILHEALEKAKNEEAKFEETASKTVETIEKFVKLIEAITGVKEKEENIISFTKTLEEYTGETKTIDSELKSLQKIFSELKMQETLNNEYKEVLARAQTLSNEIEELKKESKELSAIKQTKVTPEKLEALKTKLEESRNKYLYITNLIAEERGEIKLLREKIKHQEEKIEISKKNIEAHKELLKSVEVAAASTKILEEFRVNRIENSVPLIETYASDLLSRFTEGKFTRFKLDGKFNATVVLSDGNERAVGLLSGGELSAAAMALRLAISMILNGGASQNLIILDEVLVSQDYNRAELILSSIKEVCRGQVVLIAHSNIVDDISDKSVVLQK